MCSMSLSHRDTPPFAVLCFRDCPTIIDLSLNTYEPYEHRVKDNGLAHDCIDTNSA